MVNPARAGMILKPSSAAAAVNRKPRASGDDPLKRLSTYLYVLVNPARAGMIPRSGDVSARTTGKPRASGDDPLAEMTASATTS